MRVHLLLLLLLLLSDCVTRSEYEQMIMSELNYTQDARTGLCFAVYAHDRMMSFSYVPCASIPSIMLHPLNSHEKADIYP